MDDTVDADRERPDYEGQLGDHRVRPSGAAAIRSLALDARLETVLADRGVTDFYEHQAAAIEAIRDGDNVVLATSTALGKSLAYTVPAFERAMDHVGTTLYVGPQVALINDQRETPADLADGLGFGSRVTVDEYTPCECERGCPACVQSPTAGTRTRRSTRSSRQRCGTG